MGQLDGLERTRAQTQFNSDTAAQAGRKGGRSTARRRRDRKKMRAAAEAILSAHVHDEERAEVLKKYGISDKDATEIFLVVIAIVEKAQAGDVPAARFLVQLIGEDPSEEIHREELQLKRDMFEYQKERDAQSKDSSEATLAQLDRVLNLIFDDAEIS